MSLIKIKNDITLQEIESILKNKDKLSISSDCVAKIKKSKEFLDTYIEESTTPVYGVTTGFGSLYDQNISKENLSQLQENLLLSHACGMGKEVPVIIPKLMLLLKAQSLSYGHSGVQLSTVEALIDLYNKELIPVVYEKGSLGASGDLAPLAHMALALIGMGEVNYEGKRQDTEDVLIKLNLSLIYTEVLLVYTRESSPKSRRPLLFDLFFPRSRFGR
jgi:histidine ammonia-lyase